MLINIEGGSIEPVEPYKTRAMGDPSPTFKYRATSDHVSGSVVFWSKPLAEYYIWVINERVEAARYRGAL